MPARPPADIFSGKPEVPTVQRLVLGQSGQLLASDDLIFSTKKWGSAPVFGWLPFFEGVWASLFSPPKNSGETVFSCIQLASPELPGIYDFHFSPIFWEAQPALNCSIVERTGHYLRRRERQQAEVEDALTAEKAALAR